MDIRVDGKNTLHLASFLEDFKNELVALKKTIEEKDLHISSLETRLEKLEKSHQEEVRDQKNDILALKEKVLD